MKILPIGLKAANEYVSAQHRHHKPVRGCKFCVSVENDSGECCLPLLVGGVLAADFDAAATTSCCRVAICGRPVSRYLDNATRCCGSRNRAFDTMSNAQSGRRYNA